MHRVAFFFFFVLHIFHLLTCLSFYKHIIEQTRYKLIPCNLLFGFVACVFVVAETFQSKEILTHLFDHLFIAGYMPQTCNKVTE